MSRDLNGLYRALAADTDERVLPTPDRVRRRADRRARQRAAVGALTVAVLVAGTAAGTRWVLAAAPDRSPGPPAATPTTGPTATSAPSSPATASPTPSTGRTGAAPSRTPGAPTTGARPPATPTTIPDRAFFTLAAANDAGTGNEFTPGPVLPALCDATPGEAQLVTRRARSLPFRRAGAAADEVPAGSYRHSVAVYRTGFADDALRELRQAVTDCPTRTVPGAPGVAVRQRLLPDTGYGDESVLFETRTPYRDANGDPTGGDEVHLIRAIRSGDVVTVLWEQGWESTSTERVQFDADSRRAVEAIRRWLT